MKLLPHLIFGLLLVVSVSYSNEADASTIDKNAGEKLLKDEPAAEDAAVQPPRGPCANWMGGSPGYPGHNGAPGRDGRDGKDGIKGEKGNPGESGPKGDHGEPGGFGAEGPRGFPGTPGLKGEKGESSFLYRSAFSVGLTTRASPPSTPIKFNKIFYNEQKHYDETTGKFHCTIPGVYYFSYHLTVYLKDVKVSLYKNNKAVMFTFDQFQSNNVDQASGSVLLHLEAGDEIWLQVYGDETYNGIYADNDNDSTFMGFLIYPDTNHL
ncbi:adiponectin [Rhinatrema bivittatum]|uniref:adiponectin n=1 Tax=Rhinatrema bivittatum TaxID=194408 RepID=UPI001129192B|nr:adiponectin [Rhinatrema bivittatum]